MSLLILSSLSRKRELKRRIIDIKEALETNSKPEAIKIKDLFSGGKVNMRWTLKLFL